MVLSWAVTSERVLGRLWVGHVSTALWWSVVRVQVGVVYYFSTHGCSRFDSCLEVGALEELACAACCCRAFRLKKSAMVKDVEVDGSGRSPATC